MLDEAPSDARRCSIRCLFPIATCRVTDFGEVGLQNFETPSTKNL